MRQVQEQLQATGFNPGTIDGMLGPQTRKALQWFQNTKGLVPTGEPDEKTLDTLGVQ
jgi:peptidoglycan hydrolase-like protein with peptidoglycan-binding domain